MELDIGEDAGVLGGHLDTCPSLVVASSSRPTHSSIRFQSAGGFDLKALLDVVSGFDLNNAWEASPEVKLALNGRRCSTHVCLRTQSDKRFARFLLGNLMIGHLFVVTCDP